MRAEFHPVCVSARRCRPVVLVLAGLALVALRACHAVEHLPTPAAHPNGAHQVAQRPRSGVLGTGLCVGATQGLKTPPGAV